MTCGGGSNKASGKLKHGGAAPQLIVVKHNALRDNGEHLYSSL